MEHLDFMLLIQQHIPSILHFIDLYKYEDTIKEKLETRNGVRKELDRSYEPFRDGDFYDLLYLTTKVNDGITDELLVYNMTKLLVCYERLFLRLNEKLSKEQKLLLEKTVSEIFSNANNKYRHYFGELFVLDTALLNGFELNNSAEPLGNGKNAEFLLTNTQDGQTYLVEVINITLEPKYPAITTDEISDERKIEVLTEIGKQMANKTRRKLVKKLNKKLAEGITVDRFRLQPVIWSEALLDIRLLAKAIKDWDKWYINEMVIAPVALFTIGTEKNIKRWDFDYISKMLTGFSES